jgi:hypothetical protein
MEALSVFSGSQPYNPVEDLAECSGVGIADLPGNTLHRQATELQEFMRLRDT